MMDMPRQVRITDSGYPVSAPIRARMARENRLAEPHCHDCGRQLSTANGDDPSGFFCRSCNKVKPAQASPNRSPALFTPPQASFSKAEKSMIAKVHGFMPANQLLALLNDRLVGKAPHTMEQLRDEIDSLSQEGRAAGATDWASLRRLLTAARRSGTLRLVTEQVIDDFAVVFSLTPRQVVVLKDTIRDATKE